MNASPLALYREGVPLHEIAARCGLSITQAEWQAQRWRARRTTGGLRRWTRREERTLRERAADTPPAALAALLGRTEAAVRSKATHMGLRIAPAPPRSPVGAAHARRVAQRASVLRNGRGATDHRQGEKRNG